MPQVNYSVSFSKFGQNRKKKMFEQEIDDLVKIYNKTLGDLKEEQQTNLPFLVDRMSRFVENYKKIYEIESRLENLVDKLQENYDE